MVNKNERVKWEIFHHRIIDSFATTWTFFNETKVNRSNLEIACMFPVGVIFHIEEFRVLAPLDYFLKCQPRFEFVIQDKIYGEVDLYSNLEHRRDINMRLFSIFCRPDFPWRAVFKLEDCPLVIVPHVRFLARIFSKAPKDNLCVSCILNGYKERPVF